MKKLRMTALVVIMSALGLGIVCASDLPRPAVPMMIQPIFTWTGARIGGFFGYGLSLTKVKNDNTNSVYKNTNGWLGGALIGYDYQIGAFVIGALADFAGSQMRGTIQSFSNMSLNGSKINIDYVGTIRARFGYAVDRALVYATGGWVYTNIKGTFPMFPSIIGADSAYKNTVWGWTVGGGIEYAVTDNVIANLEYLYLAPPRVTFASGYSTLYNGAGLQVKERTSVIRAGVAYKF
jgi:outer membrane immunogenic protein